MVYGPAASSHLDRDNQRLNEAWLDAAMPAWFAEGANVREQHDSKRAVGVGVGLVKGDGDSGHMLASRIVDPVACLKVKHGVLKGYSVGIKNPRVKLGKADAPGGEVVGGDIVEVSIVDRPCNPTTLFELAKADGATGSLEAVEGALVVEKSDAAAFGIADAVYEQLPDAVRVALTSLAAAGAAVTTQTVKADEAVDDGSPAIASPWSFLIKLDGPPVTPEMIQGLVDERLAELGKADRSAAGRRKEAASGAAMPDGSYPIKTKADLRKAIRAVGRGGTEHDKIRKHIITRAKALGLEAMVPKNWNADGSLQTADKAEGDEELVAKAEQALRDARALAPSLVKADDGEDGGDEAAGSDGEDESSDIASAEQAIAVIAQLIISEAESLAQGNMNEACDIDLLLSAVRSLKWFKEREEAEQEGGADAEMALADQPGIAKTDAPATPAVEPTTQTSDAPQAPDTVTKADVAELVKAAVAEATEAAKERENALAADLVKANAAIEEFRTMPVPGGPALTRTAAQQAQARSTDADRMRAEAKTLMVKADSAVDPVLRKGYTDRANELLEKADA
ncbi:hypothetical protein ABT088_25260 [Streptomyces mirabilis]|uniref:hypothetical protein n=1 Tax=Streptomyces mirabilis TaxID=68239 RepID=UPI00331661B2